MSNWQTAAQEFREAAVFASRVGENGIKPDTYYTLRDGKPEEAAA